MFLIFNFVSDKCPYHINPLFHVKINPAVVPNWNRAKNNLSHGMSMRVYSDHD